MRRDAAYQLGVSGDFEGAVEALRSLVSDAREEADYPLQLQCRQDLAQWLAPGDSMTKQAEKTLTYWRARLRAEGAQAPDDGGQFDF